MLDFILILWILRFQRFARVAMRMIQFSWDKMLSRWITVYSVKKAAIIKNTLSKTNKYCSLKPITTLSPST
jgi:hypothetical protein